MHDVSSAQDAANGQREHHQGGAYLRTSSAANVDADKDSDKRQREAIQRYAKQAGFAVIDEFCTFLRRHRLHRPERRGGNATSAWPFALDWLRALASTGEHPPATLHYSEPA
jgi:hypothetical protein